MQKVPSHKIVLVLAKILKLSSVENSNTLRPSELTISMLTKDSSGFRPTKNQSRFTSKSIWEEGAGGMNCLRILYRVVCTVS